MNAPTLHPRLAGVSHYIDERRAELLADVAGRSDERLARRPAKGWSVSQILDHLQRVEGSVTRGLARELAAARERGLGPETDDSPVAGMLDWILFLGQHEARHTAQARDVLAETETQ